MSLVKKKNLWSAILLALIFMLMIMGICSMKAHAYGPGGGYGDYDSWADDYPNDGMCIWVGETLVTKANKDNIPGVTGGRAYIDSDGSLVFENVTGVKGLHRGAQVYSELDLEIKGTATLNNPNADYGILMNSQEFYDYEDPSDLTFSGDNTNIKISAKKVAIYACSVSMSGGSVEAKATNSDGQGLCLYHRAIFNKGSLVVTGGTNSISDFVYVYGGSLTAVGTLSGKPALSAQVIQNIGGDLSFTAKGSSYGLITDGVYNYAGSLYATGSQGAIKAGYYYVGYESDLQNADVRGKFRKIVSYTEGENPKTVKITRAPQGEVRYPIWVGSTVVTSKNKDNIPGVTGGKASYDPATNTLTLDGVTGVKGLHMGSQIFCDGKYRGTPKVTINGTALLLNKDAEFGIAGYWPEDEPWFLMDMPSFIAFSNSIIPCGSVCGEYQFDYTDNYTKLYSVSGNTYCIAADDDYVENALNDMDLKSMGVTWKYGDNNTRIYITITPVETQLKGSASISGTAAYGNTLTANTTNCNSSNLSYKWKRGSSVISGATAKTYKLTASDIGYKISCEITDKNGKLSGTLTATTTTTVQKAAGPAAPTNLVVTKCMPGAKNGAISNVNSRMEFATVSSFVNAKMCPANKMTGLAVGSYYIRYKETSTTKAGKAVCVRVTEETDVTKVFSDVTSATSYVSSIQYVYERHVMLGITNTRFAPTANTTRAQLVESLYNLAGKPAVKGKLPFTDVNVNASYYKAILWAYQKGVAKGSGNVFEPTRAITKQEVLTMLYNYAKVFGYKTSYAANALNSFTDTAKISAYAVIPMKWGVTNGVISGSNGANGKVLNPKSKPNRATTALMVSRFMKKIVKK